MCVVQFNVERFVTRYPEFSGIAPATLEELFPEAELYLDNTPCSPVQDCAQRAIFLNMLVAHIAQIGFGTDDGGPSQLVGRISGAAEGSVNVQADMGSQEAAAAWYMQTKYGAAFWAATARFRRFVYMAWRPRPTVPVPYSGGVGGYIRR